jgi:uncharacterized protein YdeI (YjbR/CyaY-like superfamily)
MTKKDFPDGVVHNAPADFRKAVIASPAAYATWNDITPLARNEWICWVTSAKREETRTKRITWMCENLADGKRRPCCWAGCAHR